MRAVLIFGAVFVGSIYVLAFSLCRAAAVGDRQLARAFADTEPPGQ